MINPISSTIILYNRLYKSIKNKKEYKMWKRHESPTTGFKSIYLSKIVNHQEDILPEDGYEFTKPILFSSIQHDIDSILYSKPRKSYHPITKDGIHIKERSLSILYSALFYLDEDAEYQYPIPIQKDVISIGYQFHKELYTIIGIIILLLGSTCMRSRHSYVYIAIGSIFIYFALNN